MPYAANQLGKERLAEWERLYKQTPHSKNAGHACISHLRGYVCSWHYHTNDDGWREYYRAPPNPRHGRYNPDAWHRLGETIRDPRPCRFPGADHSTLWKDRETGELVYVTQPYGIGDLVLQEMRDFCKEYGLKMKIDKSLGWHFPNETTCIVVTRDENSSVPFGHAHI